MGLIRILEKCKLICILVFSMYILIVLKLTIFRADVLYEERQINLTLFITLINIYRNSGIVEFIRLFFGNIIWFIPFGIILPILIKRKNLFLTVAIGFMFSFTIETMQYVFYKGVAEPDDLILNTLGVAIGYYIYQFKHHEKNRKKVFSCRQI